MRSAAATQAFVTVENAWNIRLPVLNICLHVEKCNNKVGYFFNHVIFLVKIFVKLIVNPLSLKKTMS